MADFTVRQGDNFRIADTLEDATGAAVDIAGHAIKLSLIPLAGGTALLDLVAASNDQVLTGSDGSKGKVSYTGGGATTATPGLYLGSWYDASTQQTFPNGGYILFEITADVPTTGTRFAESTSLEARLGITFTADEHVRANKLLADASSLIRDEFDQTIDLVEADVLLRPATTDERILLPERPVVSVSTVELDGAVLSGWYLAGDELVRRTRPFAGDLGYCGGGFGREDQQLRIVYSHGYAVIPQAVAGIAVEMVVRVWVNPASVIQENVGPVETTFAPYSDPPRGLQITDSERRTLRRLFRGRAGSVWTG